MSWRSYSWKAITCCLSKGTLVTLAIACTLGGVVFGINSCAKWADEQQQVRAEAKREACDALLDRARAAMKRTPYEEHGFHGYSNEDTPESKALYAQWEADCTSRPPARQPAPPWLGPVVGSALAFLVAAWLLATICKSTIAYCQVAVDTGRRPWYFIPWLRIGDPLPPREQISHKCATCDHVQTREETENEYRARLGLAPLESA